MSVTISSVHPFTVSMPAPAILLVYIFFFFFVFVKMIHVNILQCRRFQNNHSNLPHSSNRIHSADTKAGFWVMRHKWRSVVQRKWAFAGKQTEKP